MHPIVAEIHADRVLRTRIVKAFQEENRALTTQALHGWKKSPNGVPLERVLTVARVMGREPWEIRPDVFGYFKGRGASLRAASKDAAATRRGASLAIPVPLADREVLQEAAAARGLSLASFTATLIHTIASERLFGAVLDDGQ
jgi:hypothetical protein